MLHNSSGNVKFRRFVA